MKHSSAKPRRGGNDKKRLRRKLAAGKRSVERRLRAAVVPNLSGPLLGQANISYELAERTKATAHGGMGLVARLVKKVELAEEIDASVKLLKLHHPYHESDHVLNIASAPRGALTYPPLSGEGSEETSLGPTANLASKEKGDNSMPSDPAIVPRRTGRWAGGPA
jgi:hypothetical protein